MKIVLLCVGGISSSILAKRLQKFSDENGKGDVYQAERYGTVSYASIECDLLLIAPQIQKLITESPGFDSIPAERMLNVSEEDYSRINVKGVYGRIDECRDLIRNPVGQKGRWIIEKDLLLRSIIYYFSACTAYGAILFLEKRLSINIGIVRIFIPLMIMWRYGADVSSSKGENLVLHLTNQLCLFMLVTPFEIINLNEIDEINASMLVFNHFSVLRFAAISLLSMTLYTAYNLWKDWFNDRNRFMMRIIRDALCSGVFFLFVIIIRFAVSFFVRK